MICACLIARCVCLVSVACCSESKAVKPALLECARPAPSSQARCARYVSRVGRRLIVHPPTRSWAASKYAEHGPAQSGAGYATPPQRRPSAAIDASRLFQPVAFRAAAWTRAACSRWLWPRLTSAVRQGRPSQAAANTCSLAPRPRQARDHLFLNQLVALARQQRLRAPPSL